MHVILPKFSDGRDFHRSEPVKGSLIIALPRITFRLQQVHRAELLEKALDQPKPAALHYLCFGLLQEYR